MTGTNENVFQSESLPAPGVCSSTGLGSFPEKPDRETKKKEPSHQAMTHCKDM